MRKITFVVVIAILAGFSLAFATGPDPFDVAAQEIKTPDPSLPGEIMAFFGNNGMWRGNTEPKMGTGRGTIKGDAWLVVKSISEKQSVVSCYFKIPNGGALTAENGVAKLVPDEVGQMTLIIPVEMKEKGISGLITLKVREKYLTGTAGAMQIFLNPVKK